MQCPTGFGTCLVISKFSYFYLKIYSNYIFNFKSNLIQNTDTDEIYSVRGCVPSYLCRPGVYTKNNTLITTKCCTNDLCINYYYISYPIVSSTANLKYILITKFDFLFFLLINILMFFRNFKKNFA